MSDKLDIARSRVGAAMDDIIGVFKPGVKITVLVRRPGFPEQDFLMTDDDPAEAIALIERRIAAARGETTAHGD